MVMATATDTKAMEIVPTERERNFELTQREAKALANSSLVPKEFQGNVANALIALNLARRTGFDALMVMQNLDVIHGRPSFRATFLIACVNACGRFTPLRYKVEGTGDAKTCTAYAHDKETGELVDGPPVSIKMAKDEGWYGKNGSKWKTMEDLMLRYRAAAFFARTVAPEVALGMMTSDEIEDMRTPRSEKPTAMSASEALAAARDVTPPKPEAERVVDEVDAVFGLDGEEPDTF